MMFLKELSLTNIRSYTSQKISFEEGITLLAGDIGSGKTTILLALEFALFGILRGKTSPAELLRHGETKGEVKLFCVLQDKEVIITRGLRRRGSTISQLPGELSVDGVTEELVPTELKAKILSLLGYPESLLAKSTNLFRYTVYTPQEQVKLILHESVDERKDVIRKIFQIDKYQVIATNTAIYTSYLREKLAHLQGQLEDVKTLKEQQVAQTQELELVQQQLPKVLEKVKVAKERVRSDEEALQVLEKEQVKQQELRNTFQLAQNEVRHATSVLAMQQKRQEALEGKKEEKIIPPQFSDESLSKAQVLLQKCQEKKEKLSSRIGEINAKKSMFSSNLSDLTMCPTCKQEVTQEHKDSLHKKQEDQKAMLEKQLQQFKEVLTATVAKDTATREKIQVLLKQKQEFALYQQRLVQQKKQEAELQQVKQDIQEQKKLLEQKTLALQKLQKQVDDLPKITVVPKQEALRLSRQQLQSALQEQTALQTREKIAKKTLDELAVTIAQKEKLAKKVEYLKGVRTWLQELFQPLVKVMEKRVLLRVYQEFQAYFTQWFSLLVADEELEVRLDTDFTPLVQQQGFDTTITNLSGGEKTGVALAYRLALNKVLNDYFSSLHTKGLLILDEPTDGFSSEQIDRLREVFEQIGVKQLLLVSHEPRLESVADHVVRVQKQHHTSLIV